MNQYSLYIDLKKRITHFASLIMPLIRCQSLVQFVVIFFNTAFYLYLLNIWCNQAGAILSNVFCSRFI